MKLPFFDRKQELAKLCALLDAPEPRFAVLYGRRRWWGKTATGETIEIDIVARSIDGSSILLGEAEWGDRGAAAVRGISRYREPRSGAGGAAVSAALSG